MARSAADAAIEKTDARIKQRNLTKSDAPAFAGGVRHTDRMALGHHAADARKPIILQFEINIRPDQPIVASNAGGAFAVEAGRGAECRRHSGGH